MVFPPLVVKRFSFFQYTSSFLFAQRTFTPFSGPFTQGCQTFKPFFVQFCQSKNIHSLKDAGVQNIECKLYPTSRNRCTAFCAAVSFFAGFRARYIFHIFFTFCSSGGSATAPSQAVTAASQYRLSTVSLPFQKRFKPLRSNSHILPFSCLFVLFVRIIPVFFRYSV